MNHPIGVLLVHTNNLFPPEARFALQASHHITLLGEVGDAASALCLAAARQPDVIVLGLTGLASTDSTDINLISQLNDSADIPNIVAIGHNTPKSVVLAALKAGAQGYLGLDQNEATELIEAITIVHRGGAVLSPQLTRWVMEEMAGKPR